MRKAALIVGLVFFSSLAWGGDGLLEINQTCAVNGGCFPGDTAGYPITIGSAGSYILSSALFVSDPDQDGITILADGVSIDLNGFTITGPVECSDEGAGLACQPGNGIGIRVGALNPARIENGRITGFGAGGVSLGDRSEADRITVEANGGDGINILTSSSVRNSFAFRNAGFGIDIGFSSVVHASTAARNKMAGINTSSSALITDSTSILNGGSGFELQERSIIRNSTAQNNDAFGIQAQLYSLVSGCTASSNGGDGIKGWSSKIEDNVVAENVERGIYCLSGSAERNVVENNMDDGIEGENCSIIENTVSGSGQYGIFDFQGQVVGNFVWNSTLDGIRVLGAANVLNNSVTGGSQFGLNLSTNTAYRGNSISNNDMGGVTGGFNLGDNFCFGNNVVAPTCP